MSYRILIPSLWVLAGGAAICRGVGVVAPRWDALLALAIAGACLVSLAALAHRAGAPLWWAWEVGYRDGLAQPSGPPTLRLVSDEPARPAPRLGLASRVLTFPAGVLDRKAAIAAACNADRRKTDAKAASAAAQLRVWNW